jgi:uncharacterized repeat protein (TIGR03803 family)
MLRYAFVLASLTACSGIQLPASVQLPIQRAAFDGAKPAYEVVYRFTGAPDGAWPEAGLTPLNGYLYGTALGGGIHKNSCSNSGCGVIFRISPDGAESIVYKFRAGKDGAQPDGGLTAIHGLLYGTTYEGGGSCPGSWCMNHGPGEVAIS